MVPIYEYVMFAYNSAVNKTTKYSPFFLLHGYRPKSIFDCNFVKTDIEHGILIELEKLNEVRACIPNYLQLHNTKNKRIYDLHKKYVEFIVGEMVLVKAETKKSKFDFRYLGPYKII